MTVRKAAAVSKKPIPRDKVNHSCLEIGWHYWTAGCSWLVYSSSRILGNLLQSVSKKRTLYSFPCPKIQLLRRIETR